MDGKIIERGSKTQAKIIEGVKKASEAIATTLGPSGKAVAIDDGFGAPPTITRDGAQVAKSIVFSDKLENMGAQLVKKAATLTESVVGDGTSTTSILIKELSMKGQKALETGGNVNEIKSGMLKAGKWMEDYIKKNAIKIDGDKEKIRKVATISANNDPEVGDLVVQAMEKVTENGLITADLASGLDTVIDITTGMKLDRGWSSPQYITNQENGTCTMENPYILVVGEKISSVNQMINIFQAVIQNGGGRPLLIVCDDIDDTVNTTIIINVLRGALSCCVVKGIDFGDARKNAMNDIAVATGATYICPENGIALVDTTLESMGTAKKVVVSKDSTIIYQGGGDPDEIKNLSEVLSKRLQDPGISDYDKSKFSKRLANLTGGIAIIKAGGASEAEKLNRKATIEDSILASKSAIEEGCCPGGGYIFFKGSYEINKDRSFWKSLTGDEIEGAKIVVSSLPVILKTVVTNAGESFDVISEHLRSKFKKGVIYDAKAKKYETPEECNVYDSAKALRVSLENSISTASMILIIDCTIIEEPVESDEEMKKKLGPLA